MTNDPQSPPFWPFVLVDVLFVGVALALLELGHRPWLWWEAAGLIVCAAAGSGAFLTPFLLRSAHSQTLAQAQRLADAAAKIQRLDELANQISNSTVQWQAVQDGAAKTAQVAADLAQNMAAEAKAFTEFLQKANDAEKAHLRLEADKLRRSEGEWVEIVVRMLDQVSGCSRRRCNRGSRPWRSKSDVFKMPAATSAAGPAWRQSRRWRGNCSIPNAINSCKTPPRRRTRSSRKHWRPVTPTRAS